MIVNFPLDEDPDVSMIAWTTTPWTLPSNLALVVNPDMDYVKVKGICLHNAITVKKQKNCMYLTFVHTSIIVTQVLDLINYIIRYILFILLMA